MMPVSRLTPANVNTRVALNAAIVVAITRKAMAPSEMRTALTPSRRGGQSAHGLALR